MTIREGSRVCEHCGQPLKSDADIAVEHWKRYFAIQQQGRDLGRHIATGGGGWRGSFYGFVAATSPGPGQMSRPDSWRCHHEHPDDLEALWCALGEARRLDAGGSYAVCSAGPGCQDERCRRDWARLPPPNGG
jgi:hypothetical protein